MKAFIAVALLIVVAAGMPSARAAPLTSAMAIQVNEFASNKIVRVHGGCGPGFHRTSTGICRRDGTAMIPLFGTCPSGYVRGSRGRCVRHQHPR